MHVASFWGIRLSMSCMRNAVCGFLTCRAVLCRPQVCTQFQAQAATQAGVDVLNRMLRCICSWMRHVPLPLEQLGTMPLIPYAFSALANEQLFDAASDLVVETIHFAAGHDNCREFVPKILPAILELVPRYDAAVAAEDEESARSYTRIFAEAGEQFLRVLLMNPKEWALPISSAVLRGARHPDSDVAEITFNFWYVLSEEINGGGRMLSDEERPAVKALFAPLFLEVVDALRTLVELPSDSDTWSADDQDDFKRFRYAVGDAIFDSCKVASSVAVIAKLYETLQQKLPAFFAVRRASARARAQTARSSASLLSRTPTVPSSAFCSSSHSHGSLLSRHRNLSQEPQQHWRAVEGCVYCLRQSISTNDPTFFAAQGVAELLK